MEPYNRERWMMTVYALQREAMQANYTMAKVERRKEHLRKVWLAAIMDDNSETCRYVEEELALAHAAYEHAHEQHRETLGNLKAHVEQRREHHHRDHSK